jgi:hypothetical protein
MEPLVFRTLVRGLAVYAAAAVAVSLFLRFYLPGGPGALSVGLLALLLAGSVGYFMGARACRAEEHLIRDFAQRPRLLDGERIVAIGPVEALGPLLTSPFTRKACIAYQYLIDHKARPASKARVRDYWGMAVTPFQIQTAAGPVRVLGYARLEGASEVLVEDEAYRAAEAYVSATAFRHPADTGERFGSLAEPLGSESDSFQDDVCSDASHVGTTRKEDTARLRGTGLRKLYLTEGRLDAGQAVCAIGYYSSVRRALVPSTRGVKQLRISAGSPEAWASESRGMARTLTGWGVGFAVLAIGGALATRWL